MSSYAKVFARFWTGETGRAIRGDTNAQVVMAYLITNHHTNMLGLYYLPVTYIANDTGIPLEGVSKALQRLCEGHFCRYDEASEIVWVIGMAKIQIGESLNSGDKRVIAIQREYESLPNNRFLEEFFEEYGKAYHLETARTPKGPCQGACQAPSKPVAVAVTASVAPAAAATVSTASDAQRVGGEGRTVATWNAYAEAYLERWGATPVRNKKVNGMLAQFIERVPAAEAPAIAAFYVKHGKGLYVSAKHCIDLLLRDAEGLRTEWATNRPVTDTEARQADRSATNAGQVDRLIADKRRKA